MCFRRRITWCKNGMIVEPVEVEYALKRLLNQAEEKT